MLAAERGARLHGRKDDKTAAADTVVLAEDPVDDVIVDCRLPIAVGSYHVPPTSRGQGHLAALAEGAEGAERQRRRDQRGSAEAYSGGPRAKLQRMRSGGSSLPSGGKGLTEGFNLGKRPLAAPQ